MTPNKQGKMAASLVHRFSRLFINNPGRLLDSSSHIHTQASPLLFHLSDKLCAEPMKKRKKLDPQMAAARSQKKIKRIDKEIKRLSRFGKILKPVEEIEGDRRKLMAAPERRREPVVLTFEESESRALLHKAWTCYRTKRHHDRVTVFSLVSEAQQEALDELRAESEELYLAAIQKDESLLPLTLHGPKETPPIKGYTAPDGEYIDTTRKF